MKIFLNVGKYKNIPLDERKRILEKQRSQLLLAALALVALIGFSLFRYGLTWLKPLSFFTVPVVLLFVFNYYRLKKIHQEIALKKPLKSH